MSIPYHSESLLYQIMNNLFSIFDPARIFNLPLNWVSIFLVMLILPNQFWLAPSQSIALVKQSTKTLKSEFDSVLGLNATPGITWLIISTLVFIAVNNFIGLYPYVFTASRHLFFTLPLGLVLWAGFFVIKFIKQPLSILSHFLPLGTPYALIPLMVIIEIVRNIIRPITLSVRLAANIVAGHLLLTLLRSLAPSISWAILGIILARLILLLILERAVALIQSYVFRILTTLYIEEVESFKINLSKSQTSITYIEE